MGAVNFAVRKFIEDGSQHRYFGSKTANSIRTNPSSGYYYDKITKIFSILSIDVNLNQIINSRDLTPSPGTASGGSISFPGELFISFDNFPQSIDRTFVSEWTSQGWDTSSYENFKTNILNRIAESIEEPSSPRPSRFIKNWNVIIYYNVEIVSDPGLRNVVLAYPGNDPNADEFLTVTI